MENEKRILSAAEWLKLKRNNGCPLHGYHIPDSLVLYSGYCKHCDRYWRFKRWIEHKDIPYWWHYFNPDTRERIGQVFSGRKNSGKSRNRKDKAHYQGNTRTGSTQQKHVDRSQVTDRKENSLNTDTVGNSGTSPNDGRKGE